MEAVIPPNRSRSQFIPYDKDIYKERHLVECFINKIKTLPTHRDTLRENGHGLHGHALSRRYDDLDAINCQQVLVACII